MQEHGNADGPNIEQECSSEEFKVFLGGQFEEKEKVGVESQKVFGVEKENFDHVGADFVEFAILCGSSLVRGPGVSESCNGKEGSDQDVGPKHVDVFQYSSEPGSAQLLTKGVIVIHGSKDTHERKEGIFVDKVS